MTTINTGSSSTARLERAVALRVWAAAALFALAGADLPALLLGLGGAWLFLRAARRPAA
ncbi:hypothetical protein [Streptomyces otsuchiensis]|uniref:hypothetical protein n=1 Tax=Streptomyces otsuchiensis TaxID=2681388 RepID=UPI00130034AC|nr:hypothetical protein [Streptomyces otsuchiensis]